jgi:hypothetical protein
MEGMSRRKAVKLTTAGAAVALTTAITQAQTDSTKECKTYSGSSRKGSFEDALGEAIKEARKAMPGADFQVKWTLKKVSGVNGGIDPLNILTVEIEVPMS